MKGIALISLIFYFLASSGIVINSHYCMKRLVAVHLFESKAKICSKCGMNFHKGNRCCHDEVKVLKMANDQNKVPYVIYNLLSLSSRAVLVSSYLVTPFENDALAIPCISHPPPLLSGQDIYLQNRVFRI